MSGGTTVDIKYLTQPHDGTPGKPWDDFEERLLDVASGRTDERGWSLADCLNRVDEGSVGGPPMPAGAAGQKAQACRRKRLKESYSLVTVHELDVDHRTHMAQNHFQIGPDAWDYLIGIMRTPTSRLQLREHDKIWDAIDILTDVGVNPNSIVLLATRIKAVNAKRPVANRKDLTDCTEKLLECLFSCSKHFGETATVEYNRPAGSRQFELAPPHPMAGQRDFARCTDHYHLLWKAACESKLPGFHTRAAAPRQAANVRQTLESGLSSFESNRSNKETAHAMQHAGSTDFHVPRAGSPTPSLALLASAGHDLAGRHGTTTTTDFGMLTTMERSHAAEEGSLEGEFECVYIADADDTVSVEIVCDCCGGLGHIRRVCPSNRNRARSLSYIIATLEKRRQQKDGGGPPRRPPPRGQRAPFRAQPRRYSAARRSDGSRVTPRRNRGLSAEEGEDEGELFSADGESDMRSETGSSCSRPDSSSERSNVAQEQARSAAPRSPAKQPVTFSDDSLYEQESLHRAAETAPSPTLQQRAPRLALSITPLMMLMALLTGLFSLAAATLEGIARCISCLGIAGIATVIALSSSVFSLPTESVRPGREEGFLMAFQGGIACTVDSGATSTAISLARQQKESLIEEVTNADPRQKIYIADDRGLDIAMIGKMTFPCEGYELFASPGVTPRDWSTKPCTVSLPSSRTLVVDGLADDTILLSVKGMKRDGIKTFLNDDNSIQREDCLLIERDGRRFVVPFASGYAYQVKGLNPNAYQVKVGCSSEHAASAASDIVTSKRSPQAPARFHCAIGHVGARRMHDSNLVIDGVKLSTLKHDEASCPGCRLGNSGRNITAHRKWATSQKIGPPSQSFTHFGQQMDSDLCTGFTPSFPHGFIGMLNFKDRWGAETFVYFCGPETRTRCAQLWTTCTSRPSTGCRTESSVGG